MRSVLADLALIHILRGKKYVAVLALCLQVELSLPKPLQKDVCTYLTAQGLQLVVDSPDNTEVDPFADPQQQRTATTSAVEPLAAGNGTSTEEAEGAAARGAAAGRAVAEAAQLAGGPAAGAALEAGLGLGTAPQPIPGAANTHANTASGQQQQPAAEAVPTVLNRISTECCSAWDTAAAAARAALMCHKAVKEAVSAAVQRSATGSADAQLAKKELRKAAALRDGVLTTAKKARAAARAGHKEDADSAAAAAEREAVELAEFARRVTGDVAVNAADINSSTTFTKGESEGLDLLLRHQLLADTTPREMKRLLNRYLLAKFCCKEVSRCFCVRNNGADLQHLI